MDPRVAVVVITRDRPHELRRAVAHLRALPEQPEIVVVDNASASPPAVPVRVIALPENLGARARNVGVAAVRTPYVAFADDDSWWAPGALARAADALDADPRLALVNGHILVGDDEREDPLCAAMARSPLPRAPGQAGHPLLSFIACGAVVRRRAFLAAGGFKLAVGGEEELLGHDLAARGWLMSYLPDVVAHHHPSSVRDPRRRRTVQARNAHWTAWLRRPALGALAHSARHPRGLVAAARGLPGLLRERRPDPPHVEALRRLLDTKEAPWPPSPSPTRRPITTRSGAGRSSTAASRP